MTNEKLKKMTDWLIAADRAVRIGQHLHSEDFASSSRKSIDELFTLYDDDVDKIYRFLKDLGRAVMNNPFDRDPEMAAGLTIWALLYEIVK